MELRKHFRIGRFVVILLFLVSLGTITVFAAASGPVDQDVSISAGGADDAPGGNANIVRATSTAGPAGPCTPAITGAFSRDVSSPNSAFPAQSATFDLTVSALGGGNQYPLTLTLYDTVGGADIAEPSTAATLGSNLGSTVTLNAAPALNSTITFITTPAFVTAANTAITGDGRLTVMVQISGCSNSSVNTIDFMSQESGTPGIFSFVDTNAVTLSTFHAAGQDTLSWPLLAVVAAGMLVLGFAAVTLWRKRTV